MATRKVKHARALEKREKFLKTAREGTGSNTLEQLKALQTQLVREQKVKRSQQLAKEWRESKQNGAASA